MNSSSLDIKDMLEADSSLGLVFATDLFIGLEPSSPDNCVTIFDTYGRPNQLTLAKGEDYFYPSIQIRARNNIYTDGWLLLSDIITSLHGRAHETWNGVLYTRIAAQGEPALLDWDANGRVRLVANFNIQRTA